MPVALLTACNAGAGTGTETGPELDPGDAAMIGCKGALWARIDEQGVSYTHLYRTAEGGTLLGGDRHGVREGVIVRRGADAEVVSRWSPEPRPDVQGSDLTLGGVDGEGRYAVVVHLFLGTKCWWDQNDEPHCTDRWEHSLQFHDRGHALLWEEPGDHTVIGVRVDGRVAALDEGALVVRDSTGAVVSTIPLAGPVPFALASDGGYFATSAGAIVRTDADLVPRWSVSDPFEGALTRLAEPVADGGLVVAGASEDWLRMTRWGADGVEVWRRDLAPQGSLTALAAGPEGDVAVGGPGWLAYLTAAGDPGWSLLCPVDDWIGGLAVDADWILVAAHYLAAFAKTPAPEQVPFCGNGVLDPGEACDEGAGNGPWAACNEACESEFCGNGVLDPGEECDSGSQQGAACTPECLMPRCGDGLVEAGIEACDGGGACSSSCHFDVPNVPCTDPGLCPYVVWSRGFVGGNAQVLAVAHDAGGAALFGGRFGWDLDLGGDTRGVGVLSAGGESVFAARMVSPVDISWSIASGASGSPVLRTIAPAADGGVVMAGYFSGAFALGGPIHESAGLGDIFVARLGPGGEPLWSASFGDADEQQRVAAAVAGDGDVVLAGSFAGTMKLGGSTLTSAGDNDVFVARLGPEGEHRWSLRFGDGDVQELTEVAVDGEGAVVLVGFFRGQFDLGGAPLVAPADHPVAFVGKLEADGSHLWSRALGGDGFDLYGNAPRVGVDGEGAVYVATAYDGAIDFGDGPHGASNKDVAVGKLAADGAVLWSRGFGATGDQECDDLAVNAGGEIALIGGPSGGVDFGGGPLGEPSNGYVARLGPNAEHRWSVVVPKPEKFYSTWIEAVALDNDGDLLVGGQYFGALPFGGAGPVTPNPDVRAAFLAKMFAP